MARDRISSLQILAAGVAPIAALTGVAGNDAYIEGNDGKILIEIENTGGSPADVTVITTYTRSGYDLADQTITVPNGEKRYAGPFDPSIFNQVGDTAEVFIDFSASGLMFRAYRL